MNFEKIRNIGIRLSNFTDKRVMQDDIFEDRKNKSPLPVIIEWQRLYRKWAPEVWREEYSAKQSAHEIAGEFNNLADSIAKCSNKANFEIRI